MINSLSYGGAEKILKDFVIEAKTTFQESVDIAVLYDNNSFQSELISHHVKVINLGITPKFNPIAVYRLVKLVKRNNYQIIHTHLFPAGFFMAAASWFTNRDLRIFFTEHSPYNRRRDSIIGKLLDKFTYARYQKIICVSEAVKKELIAWIPLLADKISVIPNAVKIYPVDQNREKNFDVIFIGRLIKAKGVDVLLTALRIIKDRGPALRTAIIGHGPLYNELRNQSKTSGLDEDVQFMGNRNDVSDLLNKSRSFVLPSRWEGIPIALLEAMASGLPVIATEVGGIPEVIDDQKTGLLVPPDNPQILANSIVSVISNPEKAKSLGSNARKKIEEGYSIKNYAETILRLYHT